MRQLMDVTVVAGAHEVTAWPSERERWQRRQR